MQTKNNYLVASFFSFLIHASLILILLGYFHNEYTNRPVLSKPIEVSLISIEETPVKKTQIEPATKNNKEALSQPVKVIDKKITPINSQENNFIISEFPFSVGIERKSLSYIYFIVLALITGASLFYIGNKIRNKSTNA